MLTITEALAEIKTVEKRIAKKREFVLGYLLRQEKFKDPLEKDGGSVSAIKRERQGISDLEQRVVDLRMAIARSNATASVTIGDETRTIAEWLVWRRDVAPGQQQFLANMRSRVDGTRREAMQKGLQMLPTGEAARPDDVIVNVSEGALAEQAEALEQTLGALDGQLSLKNATITLEV